MEAKDFKSTRVLADLNNEIVISIFFLEKDIYF